MIYHQTIVVGGGLAGLRAAVELNMRNVNVAILSKVHPLRSHTIAAQGGVNAPLGNHPRGGHDSVEKHAFDTVKGSDYLADQPAVVRMIQNACERIIEMEHWGCPFSRTSEGRIAQRPFGGAGFPRTAYSSDKTGHVLLHTLYEHAIQFKHASERQNLVFYNEWLVVALVIEDDACRGVIAMEIKSGKLEAFMAEAVIFATGGSGTIYGNSSNAVINTGMGMAVPYWAGIPLKDMEFVQFHPTTLVGSNILMTEGCRGEGGYITNSRGERFLASYPDSRRAMEVAPRDIVSRNIMTEILEGRGFENSYVHLELMHLGAEKILARLPGIRELCLNFKGIDPIHDPIPIQPGQHYTMGGIDTDETGACRVKGLYAAGECACVSVHGANRLGGNSLLETLVYGQIAGESAAKYVLGKADSEQGKDSLEGALREQEEAIEKVIHREGKENPAALKEELNRVMAEKVGIFREESSLAQAEQKVKELRERYKKIHLGYRNRTLNLSLMWVLELKGSLDVADAIVVSARNRHESRGSHFRRDFNRRNDGEWLKHTLAHYTEQGARLDYGEVALGIWEPKERKY